MFKLVVLSALLAVAAAHPGHHHKSSHQVYSVPIVQEQVLTKVGEVVHSVPTAISHQSSTLVHNTVHVVEPVVAPVVKTYVADPVLHAVQSPLVHTPLTITAPGHYTYGAVAPITSHSDGSVL